MNYSWIILSMETAPVEGQLTDVVKKVHFRRQLEDGDDVVEIYQPYECGEPSTDFTAYPDLTFDQVCGWLETGVDVAELDNALSVMMDNLKNPPLVQLPLPWSENVSETSI